MSSARSTNNNANTPSTIVCPDGDPDIIMNFFTSLEISNFSRKRKR